MSIRWTTIFLDAPRDVTDSTVAFWTGVTGTKLSPWRGDHDEFATLLPADGDAYLRVQRVQEGTGGSHLDLHVDTAIESLDEASARAEKQGAQVRSRLDDVVVLDSPGGFTFCLVAWQLESNVPSPVKRYAAGASRLDQLCLDIPPDQFETECAFWASLTTWDLRSGAFPEFRYLHRPPDMPVRLLLQRREQAGAGDPVLAHIDFACEDAAGLAVRHAAAGARVLETFPDWITMADPTGRSYCLTARNPDTGRLRT